jgi:hypothetical protein
MLAALGAVGCGGTFRAASSPGPMVYGYSAVSVGAVPMGIESYPSVYWRGSPAYLVDDTWYYPTGGGWVILQEEPRDLYRYRVTARPRSTVEYRYSPAYRGSTVQSAPPAYRPRPAPVYRAPVQSAPPAYRPPVQTAPPVHRAPVQSAPPARVVPHSRQHDPVQVAPPSRRDTPVQAAPSRRDSRRQSAPPADREQRRSR